MQLCWAKSVSMHSFWSTDRGQLRIKSVHRIFSNQFQISGLPEIWIMLDELCWAISCYSMFITYLSDVSLCFKTSPQLLQLSWRMLQSLFAVKHQRSFVDYKTLPDWPSAQVWVHKDWIFFRIRKDFKKEKKIIIKEFYVTKKQTLATESTEKERRSGFVFIKCKLGVQWTLKSLQTTTHTFCGDIYTVHLAALPPY